MICAHPELSPIVGFARTATIRSKTPFALSINQQEALRETYYRHMDEDPGPRIAIIEDLDSPPGFGAWWGEVHTTVHQALGVLGVVTNGSIRDLDDCADNFQMLAGSIGPSHAHNHVVDVACDVTIFSMAVRPGEIVHADQHGAVIVPVDAVKKLPAAIELLLKKEGVLLQAARAPGFNIDKLLKALESSQEIH